MTLETFIKNHQKIQKLLDYFGYKTVEELQKWAMENQNYFIQQCADFNIDIDFNEPEVIKQTEPVKIETIDQNLVAKNEVKKSK